MYVAGGISGGVYQSTVYYAKLNADGSLGAWNYSANSLPAGRDVAGSVTANGYIYFAGGFNGAYQSSVYYTSTSRILAGGSLDLVGLSGQNLADAGSTGGSLTAADGTFVGNLQVQGMANFGQAVSVGGNLSAAGVAIQATSDSATSFLIGDKSGSAVVNVSAIAAGNLLNDGSFEGTAVNTGVVSAYNSSADTLSSSTAAPVYGARNLLDTSTAVANRGIKFKTPLKPSTTYTFSVYADVASGSPTANLSLGRQDAIYNTGTAGTGGVPARLLQVLVLPSTVAT